MNEEERKEYSKRVSAGTATVLASIIKQGFANKKPYQDILINVLAQCEVFYKDYPDIFKGVMDGIESGECKATTFKAKVDDQGKIVLEVE